MQIPFLFLIALIPGTIDAPAVPSRRRNRFRLGHGAFAFHYAPILFDSSPRRGSERLNATIKGEWGRHGGKTRVKEPGQAERKRMMYKGGRFARGRMENERTRGGPSEARRPHFARGVRGTENGAREAYHGVIALSSINHVTHAPCSSMYSM